MSAKDILLSNAEKIHTTEMGVERIKKNLGLDCDVFYYCKKKICDEKCNIYKRGKNFYCEVDGVVITVNSFSFTIITAHKYEEKT